MCETKDVSVAKELADLREIRDIVAELLESNGIGTYGNRNPSGADTMNCPACGEYTSIKGYCSSTGFISEVVEHRAGCALVKLQELVNRTDLETEEI